MSEKTEECMLLGHDAVSNINVYRRFGGYYRLHLQGSRGLKVGVSSYETTITNYQYTWCHISKTVILSSNAAKPQITLVIKLRTSMQ